MKYYELKKLLDCASGNKICIFGVSASGCTWVFDILKAMGSAADFYCDNFKEPGKEIREGIQTVPLEELYALKDEVYVFIAASPSTQKIIRKQLEKQGIMHIVGMDDMFLQTLAEDLIAINDSHLNEKFKCILDDKEYLYRQTEYFLGYRPDLEHPKTFNEKLQLLKLSERNPEYSRMVDKYEVKKYIADKVGAEYVIPTLGIYNHFDEIDFDSLPQQFTLKCTHDSGSVIVCKEKRNFDFQKAKEILEKGLKRNFYWFAREWVYKNIQPRIIAEKYLKDQQDGELRDYKFFCFDGKAKVLLIAQGRMDPDSKTTTDFFDENQKHIDMMSGHENAAVPPHMPVHYSKMKEIAEILSADIPHLRVDFYEANRRIYVGELTFFHQAGFVPIVPYEKDLAMGKLIKL